MCTLLHAHIFQSKQTTAHFQRCRINCQFFECFSPVMSGNEFVEPFTAWEQTQIPIVLNSVQIFTSEPVIENDIFIVITNRWWNITIEWNNRDSVLSLRRKQFRFKWEMKFLSKNWSLRRQFNTLKFRLWSKTWQSVIVVLFFTQNRRWVIGMMIPILFSF